MRDYYVTCVQDIALLARRHQGDGPPQPLSMVLMYRKDDGVVSLVSLEEKVHRRRAIELSEQYGPDVPCEDAIVEIIGTLTLDGLYIDGSKIEEEFKEVIMSQINEVNRSAIRTKLLILYHFFIYLTSNAKSWTLPRNPGECRVEAYLPRILQVTKMRMSAETEVYGGGIQFEKTDLKSDLSKYVIDPDNWKEVSILEFLNGQLPEDDRLVGPRSQRLVQVITRKDDKVSWREARDHDKQVGDDIFLNLEEEEEAWEEAGNQATGYVRSKGDIRRLYEARPERMKGMRLGQFAAEYRVIKPGGNGSESALGKIDMQTDLGPASDARVLGEENLAAPQCMRLSNGTVMTRREGRSAVLHLLYSGAPGRLGHELLWDPWLFLEEVRGNEADKETLEQKNTRLAIFLFSVFPASPNDGES